MNDLRLGSVLRVLRANRAWTQSDLARAARVSQSVVSRLERGHIETTSIKVLRQVFAAIDVRVDVVTRWHGGELDRLLDAHHAAIVEFLLRRIAGIPGWIAEPEVTFSIYGERGSIDILAWNPARRALLIVEVKSGLDDIGGLVRQADRYRRLAHDIAHSRGWSPSVTGVWVAVADGRTARRRLAQHQGTLRSAFPLDGHAMESWLRRPARSVAALSFLPVQRPGTAGRRRMADG